MGTRAEEIPLMLERLMKVQGARCKVHGARCKKQGARCKVHCARCIVQDALCIYLFDTWKNYPVVVNSKDNKTFTLDNVNFNLRTNRLVTKISQDSIFCVRYEIY